MNDDSVEPFNSNVLDGIRCPKCESLGGFNIAGTAVFLDVTDDGCTDFTDMEWDDAASITCKECRHTGTVAQFAHQRKEAG